MLKKHNKFVLNVLNIIYSVFGVVSAAFGIWFLVQVTEFVSLSDSNYYMLDYRVYYRATLVAPWLFILLGLFILLALFILFIAMCGWCGTTKESRGVLGIYGLSLIIIIVLKIIAATLVFVFIDGEYTDTFVKDIVYDGYINSQSNPDVFKSFGRMEQKLRCCGAYNASDYRSWRNALPLTCCRDSNEATCEFTDKEAKKRLGCAKVASVYIKVISCVIAGVSLLISLLEIEGVVRAWKLSDGILSEEPEYVSIGIPMTPLPRRSRSSQRLSRSPQM